jgi:hypothetical protein
MKVDGFEHVPGQHCGSVAMADMLRWAGIELSEPMVFGLGSGLGFYYLKSDHMSPARQLIGRVPNMEENVAEVLDLNLVAHRTDEAEEGWEGVRRALQQGRPAMVQCDLSELPYWETGTPFNGHRVVVAGWDEQADEVLVADTHFEGLQRVDREALRAARASQAPPSFGNQFAWWELEPGEPAELEGAIRKAIVRNAEQMRQEATGVGGIEGLSAFRDDVDSWVELEESDWLYRFAYQCIEKRGTGGGMFRNLYREFLSEAAEECAEILRFQLPLSMSRNADAWSTLATYLKAMSVFIETDGEEPGEDPTHHVGSMSEAVFQFESTFWSRVVQVF